MVMVIVIAARAAALHRLLEHAEPIAMRRALGLGFQIGGVGGVNARRRVVWANGVAPVACFVAAAHGAKRHGRFHALSFLRSHALVCLYERMRRRLWWWR